MLKEHASLREWVRCLRRDAVDHDDVLVFRPVPLFVLIARFVSDDDLLDAYAEAIGDVADEDESFCAGDETQASRLETAILKRTDGLLAIRELLSVDWFDLDSGPRSASICVAYTPEDGLTILHDHSATPSFQAVALGSERALQHVVADRPELALPRLASRGATLRKVSACCPVTWTFKDMAKITEALIGVALPEGLLLRRELLTEDDIEYPTEG